MIGDVIAGTVLIAGAVAMVRLHATQRAAARKGATLGPHRRRGRVPCRGCGRFVWTDHAWFSPSEPGAYCSPKCIPND